MITAFIPPMAVMFRTTGAPWNTHLPSIARRLRRGKLIHAGTPARYVSEVIADLFEWLRATEAHPLIASSVFHFEFEYIHPFSDGNGRTGRITMNYFLVCHDHPPITIHQEDRRAYFDALEAWNERQELSPMEQFLREQTVKTWEKQLERRCKK